MSNSEIKIRLSVLENEYEAKRMKIKELLKEMTELESEFKKGNLELNTRKNILL